MNRGHHWQASPSRRQPCLWLLNGRRQMQFPGKPRNKKRVDTATRTRQTFKSGKLSFRAAKAVSRATYKLGYFGPNNSTKLPSGSRTNVRNISVPSIAVVLPTGLTPAFSKRFMATSVLLI